MSTTTLEVPRAPSLLERFLRLFSDVRAGEGGRTLLMLLNVFLILVSYYILKTVREPLILTTEVPELLRAIGIKSAAEVKTYAAAGQAITLMAVVPAYGWFAAQVDRSRLVLGVTLFFVLNIVAFALGVSAGVNHVGVYFYVWVGIFSLMVIAQFWAYANDTHSQEAGSRLFPIIAIGSTVGSPVGAWVAARMFDAHFTAPTMLYLAAALLFASVLVFAVVDRGARHAQRAAAPSPSIGGRNGFALVFANPYITLAALLLVLLNVVNTTGEYILSHMVTTRAGALAAAEPGFDKGGYIGAFYGDYFFWVNVAALVLQAFLASRLVKRFGLAGVLLALPITAFGAYAIVAAGVGLTVARWAKTAENAADYSLMNTAKQLLWLPTTREEKYKAKQAVDAFFYRMGDLLAAVVVYVGVSRLGFGSRAFALVNLGFVLVWIAVGVKIVRENRRLSALREAERAGATRPALAAAGPPADAPA
jgi:AAA family ATP:ADP antiporter